MSLPLEDFTAALFQPLVGGVFQIDLAEERRVALELVEVRLLGHRRNDAARDPFGLTFRGSPGLRIGQGTFPFQHEELGKFEIFVTQVADQPGGSLFEAIFT